MSRATIAEALKEHRKSKHLSAAKVIELLKNYEIEISPKSLYSYESGHRQPDADTLMALCDIYEISDILGTFGYKKEESTDVTANELSENESIFTSLPPDLRQEALRYMRYLAEQERKL